MGNAVGNCNECLHQTADQRKKRSKKSASRKNSIKSDSKGKC